jgi:hypothetical protein
VFVQAKMCAREGSIAGCLGSFSGFVRAQSLLLYLCHVFRPVVLLLWGLLSDPLAPACLALLMSAAFFHVFGATARNRKPSKP